jgi:predicted MFS family arabinose efflux permease
MPYFQTETVSARAVIMSKPWYRNYVLGVLFLAYVANTIDRSSVLAVSLQAIKLDFGATDTQLGLLGGIAFALFYSTLGIPIAAWADRTSRRNVLALAVGLWSAMTALCGWP